MFSYFQGNLRHARRTIPSQAQSSSQLGKTSVSQEGPSHVEQQYSSISPQYSSATDTYQHPAACSPPPSLPPIPRIASHQESQGKQYLGSLRDASEEQVNTGNVRQKFASEERRPRTADQTSVESTFTGSTQVACDQETSSSYSYENSETRKPSLVSDMSFQEPHKKQNRSYTEPYFNHSSKTEGREAGSVQHPSSHRGQFSNPTNQTQFTGMISIPAKPSRPKLNLRNPIAILSRRRTAQTNTQPTDYAYLQTRPSSARNALPDNYDPRIRGKVVHDFSAPRPIRYGTSRDLTETRAKEHRVSAGQDEATFLQYSGEVNRYSDAEPNGASWDNRSSPQYTPVFKEHFENELEPWRFDSNDRRNQNTTGLLERMSDHETEAKVSPLPPFARSFPIDVAKNLHMSAEPYESNQDEKIAPNPIVSTEDLIEPPQRQPPPIPHSTTSPPKSRSRATSINDSFSPSSGLPKHMRSNASRFSFDLAGVGSAAQEKLLEDKHRQKTARKPRDSTLSAASNTIGTGSNEDDDFGDEGFEFDDGLEEKIPGVNADEEEDYPTHFNPSQTIDNSDPRNTQQPLPANLPAHDFYLQKPTQSSGGNLSGLEIPQAQDNLPSTQQQPVPHFDEQTIAHHSYVPRNEQDSSRYHEPVGAYNNQLGFQSHRQVYDDDLYFDDGMIDDFDVPEGEKFDESVFDDDTSRIYGHPLRNLKTLPVLLESSSAETSQQSTRPISTDSPHISSGVFTEAKSDADRKSMPPPSTLPVRKSSLVNKGDATGPIFDQAAGLTQTNLDAYHSALAMAADRAAREGRFDRKASIDESSIGEGRRLRVSFEEHQIDQVGNGSNQVDSHNNVGDFDFNDDEDDDAIIAAANAEALENDDEGFYGQEFGFFAHANGSAEAMYANGGYFGVGSDGVKRSHSGKANFQEPSLTPITERSEWSQRNSMVSMAMQGVYSPSLSQYPGLSQLADAMQYEEADNMSLSALMKLRKGAFGGSSTSLQSLGSRSASPSRLNAHLPSGIQGNGINGSHLADSSLNLGSAFEEDCRSESPTLTLQTHGLLMNPTPVLQADRSSGSDTSPKRRNAVRVFGHSRNSSGAESVSYVTETDEDGAKRWVLEKRRMVEGGGMEILGRQIVEGGRI